MSAVASPNGIISTKQITWNSWEPGGEYTKVIKIKNIDTKTQKIKYKTPQNKCFSTKYPHTITLCSGNTAKIPITFKPLEKELYSDEVEFSTKTNKFKVNVKAVLPEYAIDLPHAIDFGTCGVQNTVTKTFTLVNKSIETYFKWDIAPPFSIEPALGMLPAKEHCEIKVQFTPSEAHVYDSKAVISFGNGQYRELHISGIGKHPYIVVGDGEIAEEFVHKVIDFGDISIGTCVAKTFEVKNMSPVEMNFDISHQISGTVALDKVFVCKQRQHNIKPYSSTKVKISFLPTLEKMNYTDYFYISPVGFPSQCVVKCTGSSIAPNVILSTNLVAFRYTEVGKQVKEFINITNNSNVKTYYQIVLDSNESVFSVDKSCGVLEPQAEVTTLVRFLPLRPIPYYKRITVLVHRQDPLYLDILGSGFTNDIRPAKLSAQDLANFNDKIRSGLSVYPPEVQCSMLTSDLCSLITGTPVIDLPPSLQYFSDSQLMTENCTMHVTMDLEYLDFGKCLAFQRVHHKTVTITNHTRGRVTAIWNENPDSVFTVLPAECDIAPYKSASFRVNFDPQRPNQFYGADLECVSFYKGMRDTQLIDENTICAPWSSALYCTGETFEAGHEPFLPRYETDTTALLFPPALPDQPVFRTLLLRNTGDTPMSFNFGDDPMGVFCVKPTAGVIYGDVAIVMVRFLANQARIYQYNLKCTLNTKHSVVFPCVAAVELPTAWCENKNIMCFKPTCVGNVTEQWYGVRNTSRLPLNFEWKVAQTDSVSVSPLSGVILPNDTQYQRWKFKPTEMTVQKTINTLSIYHMKNNRRKLTISVLGQGCQTSLECLPKEVNFGITVVGEVSQETVSLHNPYSCTADYSLFLEHCGAHDCVLKLDKMSGSLTAFGKEELHITYQPASQTNYHIHVKCKVNNEEQLLLTLKGEGVFPKLSFIDIRSVGILCNVSKKRMWDLFSLDLLNKHLAECPDPKELRHLMETRTNDKSRRLSTRAQSVIDFGSNTVGSVPSKVVVVIKNNGKVPASFKFLFPPDLCLEMATWSDDQTQDLAQTQQSFDIEPREGVVKPGSMLSLLFVYKHDVEGVSQLPILLKLSRGREIMLQLRGVTVSRDVAYPQFAHFSHTLSPVVIGSNSPPIQYYELYNGGDCQLSFEVFTDSLAQLTQDNFGCDILQCLQTTGRVQPHSITHIPFLFSPLEVKTYAVEVPIMVVGDKTYNITLFGEGITPEEQKVEAIATVPDVQAVLLQDQLAVLSSEHVDFGVVPTFSLSHKVIFITNTSNETVTFRWNTHTTTISSEVLSVSPAAGTLAPRASTMIQISLKPSSYPAIFDLDIICELTDNSKEAKYEQQMAEYERLIKEDKITFTITDVRPKTPTKLDKSMDNWVASDNLNKYHTLPPIRALAPSPLDRPQKREHSCTKKYKHNGKKKDKCSESQKTRMECPVAPKPFYLHLRVTGRVEDIKQFSGDLSNFEMPITSIMNTDLVFDPEVREVTNNEVDTISNILSFVLKSLLDDTDVHKAISNLANEQIPYFEQITRDEALSCQPSEVAGVQPAPRPTQNHVLEHTIAEVVEDLASEEAAEDQIPGPSGLSNIADDCYVTEPKLSPLLKGIIEETIANIIQESVHKELILTARPRTIALPPRSPAISRDKSM